MNVGFVVLGKFKLAIVINNHLEKSPIFNNESLSKTHCLETKRGLAGVLQASSSFKRSRNYGMCNQGFEDGRVICRNSP